MNTMRLPSRFFPPRAQARLGWLGTLVLIILLTGFAYFIYSSSTTVRLIVAAIGCYIGASTVVIHRREKRRFELLSESRNGESICVFAKSFDTRTTDTWVIRAVHQELQAVLHTYAPDFPVRASDLIFEDLGLDSDDLEELLRDVAKRSGRLLDASEKNPYYGSVNTVMDVVLFTNAQPKSAQSKASREGQEL